MAKPVTKKEDLKSQDNDLLMKKKLLEAAKNKLNKKFGDNTIIDIEDQVKIDTISSGSMLIDQATGVGGWPEGRLVEIVGASGSGKTSLSTTTAVEAQRKYPNKMILFVDLEQASSIPYMRSLGLDTSPDRFMLVQPDSVEEAFEICDEMVRTGLFSLVIFDSIGNAVPKAIIEKGYDELTMGSLAKSVTLGLNKLKPLLNQTNTLMLLINTYYAKLSYMGGNESKGGAAVKYLTSIRVQVSKKDLLVDEDNKERIKGQILYYKFIKNKVGQPFVEGQTSLIFYQGFSKLLECIDLAIQYGFIVRGGAYYKFTTKTDEEMSLMGKDRVVEFFENSPEEFEYLQEKVMEEFTK